MSASATVFNSSGPVSQVGDPTLRLRCASVLKPLYAWVVDDHPRWWELAAAAICRSSNAATDELVSHAGGHQQVAGRLAARTDVTLRPAATWGQFPVVASELAQLYAALQAAAQQGDSRACAVLSLLRHVRPAQRFSLPPLWAHLTGQDPAAVGTKAGWDLSDGQPLLHTHAAVVGPQVSVAVVTAVDLTFRQRRRWRATLRAGGPEAVAAVHRRYAGRLLREAVSAASTSGAR